MTRGTFICIYDNDGSCLKSTEFNGDMYICIPGHGLKAYEYCQNVNSIDEFMLTIKKFDDEIFGYGDISFTPMNINLGFYKDLYGKWNYSDYLYIVNLTETSFNVDSYNGDRKIEITPKSVKILYFGSDFDFEGEIADRKKADKDEIK